MSYMENIGNRVVAQTIGLNSLDSQKVYNPLLNNGEHAPYLSDTALAVANALPIVIAGAMQARDYADSWRNFRVGASALAIYRRGPVRSQMFVHGANMKPTEADTVNIHAEHTLMTNILAHKEPKEVVEATIVAVVGDLQPDQQSGTKTRTLHPCGVCREAFAEPDSPINERTIFVTANPTLTIFEWFSVAALNRIHQQKNAQATEIGHAIFDGVSPLPSDDIEGINISGTQHAQVMDSHESQALDGEFLSRVQLPVIRYALAQFEM